MRIVYQDRKILMSFTKKDREEIEKAGTMPMNITLGQFKSLLADINAAHLQVWHDLEIDEELRRLRR